MCSSSEIEDYTEVSSPSSILNGQLGVFSYEKDLELDDSQILSRQFINLKRSIRRHLETVGHLSCIENITQNVEKRKESNARNKLVGMRCMRICYLDYQKARPFTDYEDHVALNSLGEIDMGNINHSRMFSMKFLPFVANVIQNRVKGFLSGRMIQTGFKPPVKIIADKDTHKHRTRQLVAVLVVVPDAETLIQPIYLGHPVVLHHTGKGVSDSIISVMDDYISKEQYEGGSYDGQYHWLSVPDYLNEHYEVQSADVHSDHDLLHKVGICDKHIRKDPNFQWLCEITSEVSRIFKEFNYGKNYEKLIIACDSLDISLRDPKFFSDTRFPNSCFNVYNSFLIDMPALINCLEKTSKLSESKYSKDRDLAKSAGDTLRKIKDKKFILTLCGVVDIYSKFSIIVSIVQKVNKLPFERYDEFMSAVTSMENMKQSIKNHSKCPMSKCLWPNFHSQQELIKNDKSKMLNYQSMEQKEDPQIVTRQSNTRAEAEKI